MYVLYMGKRMFSKHYYMTLFLCKDYFTSVYNYNYTQFCVVITRLGTVPCLEYKTYRALERTKNIKVQQKKRNKWRN